MQDTQLSLDAACLRARELAARWFLESGIQEPFGGVARYYRTDFRRNYRVSTEITGYAVSTLTWLHRLIGDPRLLEAARRAARFLIRRAWDPAGALFPFEYARDGDYAEPLAYFFDNAIVLRGLLALWRDTREAELLETARRVGAAMVQDFRASKGYHPVLVLPEKTPAVPDARWSRNPGCYHLKAALAWRELDEVQGSALFRPHCERLLEYALATHDEFLGESLDPSVMDRLHAYCYFLEGLLAFTERAGCREALREGILRATRVLEAVAPQFERCDVRAQLLRVRLLAQAQGVAACEAAEVQREAARLLEFQCLDADPRLYGGFRFGRRGAESLPYINPYSTAFAVQALEMVRDHTAGGLQVIWQDLI